MMFILLRLTTPCTAPSCSLSASTVITASSPRAGQNRNADTATILVPGHSICEAWGHMSLLRTTVMNSKTRRPFLSSPSPNSNLTHPAKKIDQVDSKFKDLG